LNFMFNKHNQRIDLQENNIRLLDPANMFKRGYSLSLFNGKAISANNLPNKGEIITTQFSGGKVISEVKDINLLNDK